MKIMVAMCVAVAALAGTVALLSDGSSDDETRVRNAAFAASEDLTEPGITEDEYRDLTGKIRPVSLSDYDCLKLKRQDDKHVRLSRFAQIEDARNRLFGRRVDILRPWLDLAPWSSTDEFRSERNFKDLYYRLQLLHDLKLLRTPETTDRETFRNLKDYDDFLDRIESSDFSDIDYLMHTQELLDRLREGCEYDGKVTIWDLDGEWISRGY